MLPPDSRRTALEMIRAPVGYQLDFAVLTTYTLDLEVLLALPLSTLSHPDGGLEELLADPLRLHQAIREAGDRVHAFVDAKGIGVPRGARPLYSMLESSVHAVRAPNGGAFHPKVWVARFTPVEETQANDDRLRVAVLSRNLTFDRSWDVALTSEAELRSRRRAARERTAERTDQRAAGAGRRRRPAGCRRAHRRAGRGSGALCVPRSRRFRIARRFPCTGPVAKA